MVVCNYLRDMMRRNGSVSCVSKGPIFGVCVRMGFVRLRLQEHIYGTFVRLTAQIRIYETIRPPQDDPEASLSSIAKGWEPLSRPIIHNSTAFRQIKLARDTKMASNRCVKVFSENHRTYRERCMRHWSAKKTWEKKEEEI